MNEPLETGLSYIGLALEHAENEVAQHWANYYENQEPAVVKYPEKYSLLSEKDRREIVNQLKEMLAIVPSIKYKKELAKQIAEKLLGNKVRPEDMNIIYSEIDAAVTIDSDPNHIAIDMENGLVTADTASVARGYPEGEAAKAQVEYAARLQLIQQSQMKPTDNVPGNPTSKNEKLLAENPHINADPAKKRGPDKTPR